MLSKYDDVEEMALKKKRANRLQIGGSTQALSTAGTSESKAKAAKEEDKKSFEFTKKHIGSDYYASHEEDPLAAAGSGGTFRKKSNKRSRMNPASLALADNEEEDIVTILER